MKVLVFFLFFILFINYSYSQIYQPGNDRKYTYDAAGNRIQRAHINVLSPERVQQNNTLPTDDDMARSYAMKHGISVFPNPVNDYVNITISTLKDGKKAVLDLFDGSGKTIFSKEMQNSEFQTDFSSLKPGLYHLKVTTDKESIFYRIIKQ